MSRSTRPIILLLSLAAACSSSSGGEPNDGVPPTVTIDQAPAQVDPSTASPLTFAVVFSESVTGFSGSDVSFSGSTVGGSLAATVTGTGTTYSVAVSGMVGNGQVVASIPAGVARDGSGTLNAASTSLDNAVTFQDLAPTVAIDQAVAQTDPVNAGPIRFSAVFSEPVTGFTAGDVSFTGSSAAGTLVAAVSGSGASYTVSVTGMTGSGTVVASIPAGAALDAAGQSSGASSSLDNAVTFDNARPSVTVNQAPAQGDPTTGATILFSVLFSEPVTGFAGSDVSFTGSSVGGTLQAAVSGSGTTYTISVTGMSGAGTVVVSLPAGGASDAAGNTNLASTSVDNVVTHN